MTGQPGQRARVIEVRLSGERDDIEAFASLLAEVEGNAVAGHVALLTPGGDAVSLPALEVLRRTGPRGNRYDDGIRVYLTVRVSSKEAPQ